jgi:hypothetical protein
MPGMGRDPSVMARDPRTPSPLLVGATMVFDNLARRRAYTTAATTSRSTTSVADTAAAIGAALRLPPALVDSPLGDASAVAHRAPVKVGGQAHTKPLTKSVHEPPFWHGCSAQSSIFMLQAGPAQPARQAHRNALTSSTHVPPLAQGLDAHSLIFVSHNAPLKPGMQLQVKLFTPSMHVLLCKHGPLAHSSMFVSQFVPS